MRHDSSATFVFIGDHSQDGTWPRISSRVRPDRDRTSLSSSVRAQVAYGSGPPRPRA